MVVFRFVCIVMVLLTAALSLSSWGADGAALAEAAARPAPGAAPAPSLDQIAGTKRKIRMIFRTHYLQLLSNGTVRGTDDVTLLNAVLQRTSVTMGKVKIQGVTTCMYLCVNNCGMPYASKYFTDECVFNEKIEAHHYNTYSSAKYSNQNRTLYLGLTRRGMARTVPIRGRNAAIAELTKVLTLPVSSAEVEVLGAGPRCPQDGGLGPDEQRPTPPVALRCRRPHAGKRKKRKRCRPGTEGRGCTPQGAEGPPRRKGGPPRRRKGGGMRERPGPGRRPRPPPGPTEASGPHRVRHRKHRTAAGVPPPFLLEEEVIPTTTEDDPLLMSAFDYLNESNFEDNESE